MAADVHASDDPGSTVQPATSQARIATGVTLRRMLSAIFQRESAESGSRFEPLTPGTRDVNQRSSCQSPRIHRCLRRVDVR